jgi:hypothetical protein
MRHINEFVFLRSKLKNRKFFFVDNAKLLYCIIASYNFRMLDLFYYTDIVNIYLW